MALVALLGPSVSYVERNVSEWSGSGEGLQILILPPFSSCSPCKLHCIREEKNRSLQGLCKKEKFVPFHQHCEVSSAAVQPGTRCMTETHLTELISFLRLKILRYLQIRYFYPSLLQAGCFYRKIHLNSLTQSEFMEIRICKVG